MKIIFTLRLTFFMWLFLALATLVLFEFELYMPGIWAGMEMNDVLFCLQTGSILLTLCVIPVSLKLLHWRYVRKQIVRGTEGAEEAYLRWSSLRCSLLGFVLFFNLLLYYCTLEKANALCALILLFAYCFCWPSQTKLKAEMEPAE